MYHYPSLAYVPLILPDFVKFSNFLIFEFYFSRRQFTLWEDHADRVKTSTAAYFIHKDELPFQYTVGDLNQRLGAYRSRPCEIRRGDCEGMI